MTRRCLWSVDCVEFVLSSQHPSVGPFTPPRRVDGEEIGSQGGCARPPLPFPQVVRLTGRPSTFPSVGQHYLLSDMRMAMRSRWAAAIGCVACRFPQHATRLSRLQGSSRFAECQAPPGCVQIPLSCTSCSLRVVEFRPGHGRPCVRR